MKKINDVLYKKLILQAEEAKMQGLEKTASNILESLTNEDLIEKPSEDYSYEDLKEEFSKSILDLAIKVTKYHNLESLDYSKLESFANDASDELIEKIEDVLGVEAGEVGPFDKKTMGEL